MRTGVMWRPPGDERRQQRRSGAGRHITVLATQPQQIGGIALRAEVGGPTRATDAFVSIGRRVLREPHPPDPLCRERAEWGGPGGAEAKVRIRG
jgi:hypothetical protein